MATRRKNMSGGTDNTKDAKGNMEEGTGNTKGTKERRATTKRTESTKRHEEAQTDESPCPSVPFVSSVLNPVPSVLNFAVPIALNPIQAAFLACAERFSFYVGGVGAGKTTAGALRAIARAIAQPGSLGLIGAPTYPMLRDATLRTFFELLPETLDGADGKRTFNKTEMRLQLENGSEILFRSLDEPDRVRGLNLAWFWLDEAPLAGYYAWQILKGRLRQRGYEHDTMGWATGTPHGRDGFWRDFEQQPRPHHALFRAATHENAAHLPPDYIADLGLAGALYEQEVLGLFTAFEGLVYAFTADQDGHVREHPGLDRGDEERDEPRGPEGPAHATSGLKAEAGDGTDTAGTDTAAGEGTEASASSAACAGHLWPRAGTDSPFHTIIGGVDWGYTHPTAALVFGLDGDGRAWQLDEFYQRRAPLDAVVLPALCALTRRWGVRTWYGGPDEPEHLAALQMALLRAGVACRVLAANDRVRPGIQTITRLLARRDDGTRGLYVAPRCVHTIAEYGLYQWEPEPLVGASGGRPLAGAGGGSEVSEMPLKQHDDAMDATRYALHTALGESLATATWLELWLAHRHSDGDGE